MPVVWLEMDIELRVISILCNVNARRFNEFSYWADIHVYIHVYRYTCVSVQKLFPLPVSTSGFVADTCVSDVAKVEPCWQCHI